MTPVTTERLKAIIAGRDAKRVGMITVVSLATELLAAREALENAEARAVDNQMRAFKWMERHDRIAAGKDGGPFPSPADLPQALLVATDALKKIIEVVSYPISSEIKSRGWDARSLDESGSEYIAEIARAALSPKEPSHE